MTCEEEGLLYTEITNAAAENKCPEGKGQLPGRCAAMAFPFVAMQGQDPKRYDQREALQQGTLFPGLDLPFHKELKSRFSAANTALSELMALDFAIDELGLYLVTHAEDQEVLALYWEYIRLAQEGRARYEAQYGPLTQTTVTEGGYRWLKDPWPWDEGGSD
ncbi:MAG: spore coat associated protein CotJA [Clostridiales bacterium]|nr:spore coat associated protein CotJA [Clostridiales bacterium]